MVRPEGQVVLRYGVWGFRLTNTSHKSLCESVTQGLQTYVVLWPLKVRCGMAGHVCKISMILVLMTLVHTGPSDRIPLKPQYSIFSAGDMCNIRGRWVLNVRGRVIYILSTLSVLLPPVKVQVAIIGGQKY